MYDPLLSNTLNQLIINLYFDHLRSKGKEKLS
jgi:hypothetical protein